MVFLSFLSTVALGSEIDPLTTETRYVDQSETNAGIALGSASQAPDTLRATWHAAAGPELYDAICVYVQSGATAGDVIKLGLYDLNASTDLPEDLLWSGEIDASTTGLKCETFADGTVTAAGASYFNAAEDRLELFSSDKIAKAMVAQGTAVTVRTVGAYGARTYGRFDDGGSLPVALTSTTETGVSGALPSTLTADPSKVLPPSIMLRVF